MLKIKKQNLYFLLAIVVFVTACKVQNKVDSKKSNAFVDATTPKKVMPLVLNISKSELQNWKLAFSDEFNDTKMDTTKWNIENAPKNRVDIMLYSDNNQVEEKVESLMFLEGHFA